MHAVVQAAKRLVWFGQVKQVVPVSHGRPQSATNVVQVPCTQATPAAPTSPNRNRDPSSATGCCAAHPHAGYVASHCASSVWKRACSLARKPKTISEPQQLTTCKTATQSALVVHERSSACTA